jgi:hypothetical protein
MNSSPLTTGRGISHPGTQHGILSTYGERASVLAKGRKARLGDSPKQRPWIFCSQLLRAIEVDNQSSSHALPVIR